MWAECRRAWETKRGLGACWCERGRSAGTLERKFRLERLDVRVRPDVRALAFL
jgi:hypothetical protein